MFFLMLVVVLFTPVVLKHLHVPRVVNVVLTKMIMNGCNFGVLRHSDDFRLFKGMKLCCVVFLTNLRVSVSSFGGGEAGKLIFNVFAFLVPVKLNV